MSKFIAGIIIAILASSAISVGASTILALDRKVIQDHRENKAYKG